MVVVVAEVAEEAADSLTKKSESSQKILNKPHYHQTSRHGHEGGPIEFFYLSDLSAEATGMCQWHCCNRGYAAKGVLLQWPLGLQVDNSPRSQ